MTTNNYHIELAESQVIHHRIRSERKLTDGKGVVVSFVFNGDPSMTINYKSQKDEVKELRIVWRDSDDLILRVPGTVIYGHIDDEINELLVIGKEDFPY